MSCDIIFQKVGMAYIAMANMDMVPFRMDWARRSGAAMERGPYPTEVLGRMEYDNKNDHVEFIY
jgi:hypothetical protein